MVGDGSGERERCKGKAPMAPASDSSMDAAILLSDSDSDEKTNAAPSRGDANLKWTWIDPVSEVQFHQANLKELSRFLSMFPSASPSSAVAHLASQLRRVLPERELARIIRKCMENAVPRAVQGPHEGPSDPPQATERSLDVFARPNVPAVGTSRQAERQVDFGSEVLSPEIRANYNLWTHYTLAKEFPRYPIRELRRVLDENNCWFAPSHKVISSHYAAALAAEGAGHGGRQAREQRYPQLEVLPRVPVPKPHEPCDMFERELQSMENASTKSAELVLEVKIELGPGRECGNHMVACGKETSAQTTVGLGGTHVQEAYEGNASADSKCWRCGTYWDFSVSKTSKDSKCGCCGTCLDASESETSTDRKCVCCELYMDLFDDETSRDV